jgi:PKD repeat protein
LKPTASFSAPTGVSPGAATSFSGSATDPFPGGTISSYSWHWDDGTSNSTGANPSHTFASAGTYAVKLTATDNYGQVGTVTHDVTVGETAPAVTSVSPTKGPPAGGTSVTINGSGFAGATKVRFGNAGDASYTVVSATKITAIAPAFTAGQTINIRVTTPSGTSAVVNADRYKYVAAPVVTSVSPKFGPEGGGTAVTINGSRFTGATEVRFGNAGDASYTVVSATKITAIAPAFTAGQTINIRVTTPSGTSAVVNADRYKYVTVPAITSVSPSSGPAGGGTLVTINGSGFTGATRVVFGNGGNASTFTVVSDSQITAISPAFVTGQTINIRVSNSKVTSKVVNDDHFRYI